MLHFFPSFKTCFSVYLTSMQKNLDRTVIFTLDNWDAFWPDPWVRKMFTLFFRVNGFFMPFWVLMFLEFQVIVFVNPYPVSFKHNFKSLCLNVSTTSITAMGCRQYLPLSIVLLKGKHCRKPHCCNGVVDTFGPCCLVILCRHNKGPFKNYVDKILTIFDYLPNLTWTFSFLNVDKKKKHFLTTYSPHLVPYSK